jgi:hypothetical protein
MSNLCSVNWDFLKKMEIYPASAKTHTTKILTKISTQQPINKNNNKARKNT